jgi:hypothetical protein
MDNMDRLNLKKMIKTNNVEDCTNEIRSKKHSDLIQKDVSKMIQLKKDYCNGNGNDQKFDDMLVSQCNFLFMNYTDIFNKVKKDEIKLETLFEFLNVLKSIEEGKIDQHEGAFEVGKILKAMYIDSAIMKSEKLDKETGEKIPQIQLAPPKNISWSEYKSSNKM